MGSSRSSGRTARPLLLHGVAFAVAASAAASAAVGQGAATGPAREVSGRVLRAAGGTHVPLPGAWVILHRVARDGAAPLDSVRSGPSGAYRFRYRSTGDSAAVYFVSSLYAGIAYFSPPLTRAEVRGDDAELVVFDTTSRPLPITIESRHVIVSAPDSTRHRTVIEVFVLTNAGSLTRVAPEDGATFETALPVGAIDPKAAEGDVAPEAFSFAGGRVRVTAPIAPGTKRVAYAYTLRAASMPVRASRADSSTLLEVLVEDSAASVAGAGVHEDAATTISGRTFRRFVNNARGSADDLAITAPSGLGSGGPGIVGAVTIAVALLLGGALFAALRRNGPDSSRGARRAADIPLASPDGTA